MSTKPEVTPKIATKPAETETTAKPAKKAVAAAVQKTVAAKPATAAKAPVAKKPVKAAVVAEKVKSVKVKMERDSFTMPKEEYAQIAALKKRLETLGKPAKKSELLRAGLKLLSGLDDAALQAALSAIPTIKTGRPNKK